MQPGPKNLRLAEKKKMSQGCQRGQFPASENTKTGDSWGGSVTPLAPLWWEMLTRNWTGNGIFSLETVNLNEVVSSSKRFLYYWTWEYPGECSALYMFYFAWTFGPSERLFFAVFVSSETSPNLKLLRSVHVFRELAWIHRLFFPLQRTSQSSSAPYGVGSGAPAREG